MSRRLETSRAYDETALPVPLPAPRAIDGGVTETDAAVTPVVHAQQPPSYTLLLVAAFLYAATAAAAFFAVVDGRKNPARHSRMFARHWKRDDRFWIVVGLLLLLGAVYRAAGLEYLIQSHFRTELRDDNLYAIRRTIQTPAVFAGLITGLAVLFGTDWYMRRRHRAVRLAALAGIALVMLLGLRAISAHGMDALFRVSIGGLKLGWLLEPGALAAIFACTIWFRQSRAGISAARVAKEAPDAEVATGRARSE